jgi:hypothetical protein
LTDPIAQTAEMVGTEEPVGNLLADLERRQDDVLAQLDDLDRRVSELLRGLGVTLIEDSEAVHFVDEAGEEVDASGSIGTVASAPSLAVFPMDGSTEQSLPEQSAQKIAVEPTGGFSKLPKGDTKPRDGKRGKMGFNETEDWKQKNRAA